MTSVRKIKIYMDFYVYCNSTNPKFFRIMNENGYKNIKTTGNT